MSDTIAHPKLKLLFLCNLFLLFYTLHYFIYINSFILSLLISGIIFIIPGLPLACLLCDGKAHKVLLPFFTILFSALILLSGAIVFHTLNIKITSGCMLIYIFLVANTAILFVNRENIKKLDKSINKKLLLGLLIFIFVYSAIFIGSLKVVPPLQDNDLDIQHTAYSLLNTLTPFTLTDRLTLFDFSHPLLINFYSSFSLLFSEQLSTVKYYYDYALRAGEILKQHEGEIKLPLSILSSDQKEILVKEQIVKLQEEKYKMFHQSPNLLYTRLPNIFLGSLTAVLLYYFLLSITRSQYLSLLGIMIYITLPEFFVSLSSEMHTSMVSFLSMVILWLYIKRTDYAQDRFLGFSLLASGFLISQASNKAVFLPLAIFLAAYIFGGKINSNNPDKKAANKILLGFILGSFTFWLYGLVIDRKTFILDHFRYHFIDRIFHLRDGMNYTYPTIIRLWKDFGSNLSLPFFIISLCSLLYLLRMRQDEEGRLSVLSVWFFLGAFAFSIVDWRETYHLMLLVLPLIIGTIIVLDRLKEYKFIYTFCSVIFVYVITHNTHTIFKLSNNFYTLASLARW